MDHERARGACCRRRCTRGRTARAAGSRPGASTAASAADGVAHVDVDLRGVERGLARRRPRSPGRPLERVLEGGLGLAPSPRRRRPILSGFGSRARPGSRRGRRSAAGCSTKASSDASSSWSWSGVQKMWLSSWVKPRTRVSPWITPDARSGTPSRTRTAAAAAPGTSAAVLVDEHVARAVHRLRVVRRPRPSPWAGTCRRRRSRGGRCVSNSVDFARWGVKTNS